MKHLNVLHVITGLGSGGAENVLLQVCKRKAGLRHVVICLKEAGVYVRRLKGAGVPTHCLGLRRFWQIIPGVFHLTRWIKITKPDVVQTWMYHADFMGGVAGKLTGPVPVIWGVRASDAFRMPGYFQLRPLVALCGFFSRILPSRIVFNSHDGARVHADIGYPPNHCEVIPNGVDSDYFAPDSAARIRMRRSWSLADCQPVLGTVARWDSIKNHALLAEALQALSVTTPQWHAVWIGPGMSHYNRELIMLLDRFSIRQKVSLLGPTTDLRGVLNGIDLHVLPSKSEGFPNVLAEAMACGTPCVATRVGDVERIVGKTGWLVNSGDPGALAEVLHQALRSMKNRRTWAVRSASCRRRMIQHFGVDRMVGAYARIWHDVAARSRQGASSRGEFPRHKHEATFQSHGRRRQS